MTVTAADRLVDELAMAGAGTRAGIGVGGRFRPARAGVINVWDYVDEEFAFAGGRLALRGHNGSGKTKALEVLFPFVLDGVADSRRLDPFSGENRTMKSNLLYRGQEAEYGYVWMEFARAGEAAETGETVTLIVGLRAHRNRDGVRTSFYVTGKRLGVDFGLLSADSRPLTERQLKAVLEPGAWHRTATEYRDAVDARLFGLGRERYTQLLDLLLALRRPLLAKDLDPDKVSDTLTSGLSPVDEDLVLQAARDFENLAAVQKLFDDLTTANTAVGEFLTHYAAYLRAHVRLQLDRVRARADALTGNASEVAVAAAEHRRAVAAERQAASERDSKRAEAERLGGRLTALKNSDEYRAQGRLEDKRREVGDGERAIADERERLGRDRGHLEGLRGEAGKLARRVAEARAGADRYAVELADAAERSGIAADGSGAADTGDDLADTARARAIARRDDVREIRRQLEIVAKAEASRARAEAELGRKEQAEQDRDRERREAEELLASARGAAAAELGGWADRWREREDAGADGAGVGGAGVGGAGVGGADVGGADVGGVVGAADVPVLVAALERIGEPGAPGLPEIFGGLIAERQASAITARANLAAAAEDALGRLARLRDERESISGEKDDAPPSSDLRTASRDGAGAPLWRLVRFGDEVAADEAAAIEGALYGAGLLTAWIHPDPELTRAALAAAEPDGYLIGADAGAVPGGRTLADVLVPEDQDQVDPAVIAAILGSIRLTDDIAAGPAGPAGRSSPAGPAGLSGPVVTTRAQFSYGVLAGARPKPAPEYIGATNRANRRRARLAALDLDIERARQEADRLGAELERMTELVGDFTRSRLQLPDTTAVAGAAQAVGTRAALLAAAREDLGSARQVLDGAIAELAAKSQLLRQAAAERAMPARVSEVDAVERAIGEFASAATGLVGQRVQASQAGADLDDRNETIERLDRQLAAATEAAAARERAQEARAEELRTLEAALGEGARQVLEQIRATEKDLDTARRMAGDLEAKRNKEQIGAARADQSLMHSRKALTAAIGELHDQARAFGPYANPALRSLLGVTHQALWPSESGWLDPGEVAEHLAVALMADEAAAGPDAEGHLRTALPAGASGILEAYHAATRGGRAVTDGTAKNTAERMSAALKEFTEALAACDEDYRVDWESGEVLTVSVLDADGRSPVAVFAGRIAERVEEQGILLEDRERSVLEDELLTGLAHQIHSRVLAARDLVRAMNEDTRSKPMSSGITIGIRWAQSDKIGDRQRAASRLLERDAVALGPERLGDLRGLLREMIKEYRAGHPRATYREALTNVLDYRAWHAFELRLAKPGEEEVRLTRAKHSVMSGGEKSASIHLPLFAAANSLYSSAKTGCPRLIALDEAFVGIDERYKPDLFGLAVKFDLDLFMTGHDLWVTYPTVPSIAHYDMYHDERTRTVSALLILWDGEQLIDADAGFAGNDELVTGLIGFRPTRHAPLGHDGAMVYAGVADDAEDGDDGDLEDDLDGGGGPDGDVA